MVAAFFITLFALAALALYLSIRFWKVARYGWLVVALLLMWFKVFPITFQRQFVKATIPPIFEVVEETQFDSAWSECTFAEYRVRRTGDLENLPPRYVDRTAAFQQALQEEDVLVDDIPPDARFYVRNATYWDVFNNTSYEHAIFDNIAWIFEMCSSSDRGISPTESYRRVDLAKLQATTIFGGPWIGDERWIYDETTGLLTYYGLSRHQVGVRAWLFDAN